MTATPGPATGQTGTYRNPVIGGFHPDPSVCRVGVDYYLACSSFEYFPGVPLFHSRDLVHWRQIGNALDRPSQLRLPDDLPASAGIYAPTLRHHDGRFWMITTNVSAGGTFVVTAERAEGPWSEPVWLDVPGFDPDLAWDDDGTCWCATSGIMVTPVDPVKGALLDEPAPVWSGTGLQCPEAPHLYRIGDWWYLMIAEGGTERGHCVSIARGRTPRGPFTPAPANPILTHRSTDRPIQSTGHADLVQAADGTWWMLLLGTRPRGRTPGFHVLGRETFLAPVTWADGWPVVGPVEEHHPAPAAWHPLDLPPVRDDFGGPALGPQWISPRRRPDDAWSLTERPGWLTLHANGATLDEPGCTFVGRRQQHPACRVAARLDPGPVTGPGPRRTAAGLSVRLDEAHHYDLEVADGDAYVVARIGPVRQELGRQSVGAGPLTLAVEVAPAAGEGPDLLTFTVTAAAGGTATLAELDGRYLSTEVATGFTGRVIGMYVTAGTAAFDWFDYEPA